VSEQEVVFIPAPLNGDKYDLDNKRVYAIIECLILERPALAYITSAIDCAKDGCNA